MKHLFFLVALLIAFSSCKPKVLSGKDLDNKLTETMSDHLKKTLPQGTAFNIKDLNYYPDKAKGVYICTFTVQVHSPQKDTVGEMKAFIPNDFSKVERIQ